MRLSIQYQIASLCFLAIIAAQYFYRVKLPTFTNKLFKWMIILAGINLTFDIITVYDLYHFDEVPLWFTRFSHQIFIGSLDLYTALICTLVVTQVYPIRYLHNHHFALALPLLLSFVAIIFGELNYCHGDGNYYSYGTMAYTIYCGIAFYLFISVTYLIWYWKRINRQLRLAVFIAIAIQSIVCLIQLIHPNILISGLGVTLMTTFIFYSLMNPSEYVEKETGMLNRFALITMLNERIQSKHTFYLVNISIDNWGLLNTRYGQDFSFQMVEKMDKMIKKIAKTSVYRARTKCFSLFVDNKEVAQKVSNQILSIFQQGLYVNNTSVSLEGNILIVDSRYIKTQEDAFHIIELYIRKDIRNRISMEPVMYYDDEYAKILNRYMQIETILKEALEQDGFYMVYQPIYSRQVKRVNCCEALVRLKDTTSLGYISPEEFIQIAEQSGWIHELGRIVFEKVCKFASSQECKALNLDYIEVNLSALQYMDVNLSKELLLTMNRYRLKPSFFNFEITESAAIEQSDAMKKNIAELKQSGCTFSMDDYGTGYSNLSMMTDMPYHIIKLDKSLIWPYFKEDEKFKVILESTIHMIKQLHFYIVAEGVETKEQFDRLTQMGVDYIQGYYFSKPIKQEEFVACYKEWNQK